MKHANKRFQVDLTDEQMTTLDRLAQQSGARTKRELFESALALFQWAARERSHGRNVGSFDPATETIREFDMPALAAFAGRNDPPRLSAEELRRREQQPGKPLKEIRKRLK